MTRVVEWHVLIGIGMAIRLVPAIAFIFLLGACAEPETLPGMSCEEAFSAVPVIGELETLDEFGRAVYEVDVTIAACESIDEWTAAAEDRLAVDVTDPEAFIEARCFAAAPPNVVPVPGDSPLPDASPPTGDVPILDPVQTPLCMEASDATAG